jgi:hypothetical protein
MLAIIRRFCNHIRNTEVSVQNQNPFQKYFGKHVAFIMITGYNKCISESEIIMILTIQQGDYVVDLDFISSIKLDLSQDNFKSADVTFAFNVHDDEFVAGEADTYTFEEEDYVALVDYLSTTAHR